MSIRVLVERRKYVTKTQSILTLIFRDECIQDTQSWLYFCNPPLFKAELLCATVMQCCYCIIFMSVFTPTGTGESAVGTCVSLGVQLLQSFMDYSS